MREGKCVASEDKGAIMVTEKRCIIVSGGEFCTPPEGLSFVAARPFIIACDSGRLHAEKLGLSPDVIIGDFDSSERPRDAATPILEFPSRKNDTDTMLAVKHALERGYKDMDILCAFGGRLDHSLGNLACGALAAAMGGLVRLYGADTVATVFSAETLVSRRFILKLPRREGYSLSLFALNGPCEGISLRGTKYDGEGLTLDGFSSLGLSNTWTSDTAEISLSSGVLTLVESRLKEGEHI